MGYRDYLEKIGYFILSDSAGEVKTIKTVPLKRPAMELGFSYYTNYVIQDLELTDPRINDLNLIFYDVYIGDGSETAYGGNYLQTLKWYVFLKELSLITDQEFYFVTSSEDDDQYQRIILLEQIRTLPRPSAKFINLFINEFITSKVAGNYLTTWKKIPLRPDTVWNGGNYDDYFVYQLEGSEYFEPVQEDFEYGSINAYDLFVNEFEFDFYAKVSLVADGQGGFRTKLDKIPITTTNEKNKNPLTPEVDLNNDLDAGDTSSVDAISIDWIKPIYGSSVAFSSRLNYLETSDNSLKIVPSSENNLITKFNFKYLLNDLNLDPFLSKIQSAEGYKNLKFSDPSNIYKDVIGLVEDYSINKLNKNINEINISISSYFKVPIFNWKTSSFLNLPTSLEYSSQKSYKKYDFVYFDPKKYNQYNGEVNKIDNFWFAKEDIETSNLNKFDVRKWTKVFNHDSKFPFNFKNKYDFYQLDYKNSFVQNVKYKENSNILKNFEFTIDNISNAQCRSILFFLEKKCGYRRFIYKFPFAFSGYMVFICTQWNHVFNYNDSNSITATFVRDPSINSSFFKFIDYDYYILNRIPSPYPELLNSL
jgi:hypothetical protein